MHGPRLFTRTHLLALAALMLLPGCSPRKPIPSDPPEVRTEAMVRGAARKAAQADAPQQPVAEAKQAEPAKPDVVVAHISDSDAKPTPDAAANAAATKAAEPKAEAAKAPEAATVAPAEAKAAAKPVEAKADVKVEAKADAKPEVKAEVKAEPAQAAPKPEPSAAVQANATAQAAKAAADPAAPVASKTPTVQIASFSTEKNADAALAWLKEKGYAEARVVRVEQGQAVYHRVQAGPFQDPAAARKALEELKADWPQAFIPAD